MTDVTAVLLTLGEPTTARARASIERQTFAPKEIVVAGDTPFHRAINSGARRVRTEFFVQVDADFVLDRDCFADLRACCRDDLGLVTGRLRDPLLGRVGHVKLFRTSVFERVAFPDTLSSDTDFRAAMERHGLWRVEALKWRTGPQELWHTFGEHCPDYTPPYTFAKFRLEGARYRYRRQPQAFRRLLQRLRSSRHAAALTALVGLAHGVFMRAEGDQLGPCQRDAEFDRLEPFLFGPRDRLASRRAVQGVASADLRSVFCEFVALGAELRSVHDLPTFVAAIELLTQDPTDGGLVALLGLCHGLISDNVSAAEKDYDLLEGWLVPTRAFR